MDSADDAEINIWLMLVRGLPMVHSPGAEARMICLISHNRELGLYPAELGYVMGQR